MAQSKLKSHSIVSEEKSAVIFRFNLPNGLSLRSASVVDGGAELRFTSSPRVPTLQESDVAAAFRLAAEKRRPEFFYAGLPPDHPFSGFRYFNDYRPQWLRRTTLGDLLSDIDWNMKCLHIGAKSNENKTSFKSWPASSNLKGLATCLDFPRNSIGSIYMYCEHAKVQICDEKILFPEEPKMKIVDKRSPQYSEYITEHLPSVAYHDEPKFLKMQEVIKLILAVEWLYNEKKVRVDQSWIQFHTENFTEEENCILSQSFHESKPPPNDMIPSPPADFKPPSTDVTVNAKYSQIYEALTENKAKRRFGYADFNGCEVRIFTEEGEKLFFQSSFKQSFVDNTPSGDMNHFRYTAMDELYFKNVSEFMNALQWPFALEDKDFIPETPDPILDPPKVPLTHESFVMRLDDEIIEGSLSSLPINSGSTNHTKEDSPTDKSTISDKSNTKIALYELTELHCSTFEQPKVGTPASEQPKVGTPASEQPKVGTPAFEQPKVGTPASEQPKVGTPASEQPKVGTPASEQPKVGTPASEQPKLGTPASEQPKVGTPASEQPKVGTPASEQPKVGTPASEQPKVGTPASELPKIGTPASEQPKVGTPAYEKPSSNNGEKSHIEEKKERSTQKPDLSDAIDTSAFELPLFYTETAELLLGKLETSPATDFFGPLETLLRSIEDPFSEQLFQTMKFTFEQMFQMIIETGYPIPVTVFVQIEDLCFCDDDFKVTANVSISRHVPFTFPLFEITGTAKMALEDIDYVFSHIDPNTPVAPAIPGLCEAVIPQVASWDELLSELSTPIPRFWLDPYTGIGEQTAAGGISTKKIPIVECAIPIMNTVALAGALLKKNEPPKLDPPEPHFNLKPLPSQRSPPKSTLKNGQGLESHNESKPGASPTCSHSEGSDKNKRKNRKHKVKESMEVYGTYGEALIVNATEARGNIEMLNDEDKKKILEKFDKSWTGNPPGIVAVYEIFNENLEIKWKHYRSKLPPHFGVVEEHYHGAALLCRITNKHKLCTLRNCEVCSIAHYGMNKESSKRHRSFNYFKNKVILSPQSSSCDEYTEENKQLYKAMLLCDVLPGRKYNLQTHVNYCKLPEGYNSFHATTDDDLTSPVLVITQYEAVLPKYIIVYKHFNSN